jgi:hypothetical protein
LSALLKIGLCAFALTASTLAIADELGRLFFTPEQRKELDYNYAQGVSADNYEHALMLNGIVQKHGGKRTAWINGVPQPVGRSDEKSPESVAVPVPGQHKSVKLKVGQRILLNPSAIPDSSEQELPAQDMPKQ